ncbi:RNA helicase, putative [Eimeria brunetti]|uniref:RNA helicase n=1 Tax=Eimeria brunetti TaxID=51314 RepID=U6LUY0_9EIME|nr:RNA helicase, putative [Eimeria brunetti]
MQQLLHQFQRGVFNRRSVPCLRCFYPPPQYSIPCIWWGFPDLPSSLDTVARIGSCTPSTPGSCTSLAKSVLGKSFGGRSITGLSAAKVSALPISPDLQEGLQRVGIRRLAEVQRICLLRALGGTSLIVAANPGAGKTLAYLLPVLQRFAEEGLHTMDASEGSPASPFALILVPSRELARQVTNVAMALLPHAPVLLLDPASPVRQHQNLLSHLPVRIVVSTPDRIRSLIRERRQPDAVTGRAQHAEPAYLSLKDLHILVVDEADCMLRRDYHSKVQFIYRTALGCKTGEDRIAERECRSSLQLLCFSAVLPANLLATFEAEFPNAEILNLLNAPKYGTQGETDVNGQAMTDVEAPSNKNGPAGSAVVGAGVRHHICYVPSWSASDTSLDAICDGSAALRKPGGRRRGQTTEEAHVEKEQKMLALAEALRTFIPRLIHSSHSSTNTGSLSTGGNADEASFPEGGEPKKSASGNNLEKRPADPGCEEQKSAAVLQLPAEGMSSMKAETGSEEGLPQCIVFADSQEEVRYIKNHPLLDSWRIAAVHSRMDPHDRERAIRSFIEGDASVLLSTDIAARGFDIPSVVLVVHLHPPSTPENYIHRTGRAGRGKAPGTSVVLCSSVELHRLRDIERIGLARFERRTLPAAGDCQELMLRQLTADMLNVPYSQYAPLLDAAQRLQEKVGAQALATALLKLGGATVHSTLGLPGSECRSVLSGRQGFVPLLLYDPAHAAVGRIVKSVNGFVADVSTTYADHIVDKAKCREASSSESLDSNSSPFTSGNGFKELSLARSRREARWQAAQKDRAFKSDPSPLQVPKGASV